MSERTFFVSPDSIRGEKAFVRGAVAHQIRTVLRLRPGDEIELLDNSGFLYVTRLQGISKDEVTAEVVDRRRPDTEPRVYLELYQALLKGQKMELVLQKGTEIGVSRFVPVLSERCVSRPAAQDLERRLDRWREIVREAAEQSGRAMLPSVEGLESLEGACGKAASADLAVMAWEEEHGGGLGQAVRGAALARTGDRPRIALLIGPEGGFSEREAGIARDAGLAVASLGPRILRAETAALVAATVVLCETGELGG